MCSSIRKWRPKLYWDSNVDSRSACWVFFMLCWVWMCLFLQSNSDVMTTMLLFTSFATKLQLALMCVDQEVMFHNVGKFCSPKTWYFEKQALKLTISSFRETYDSICLDSSWEFYFVPWALKSYWYEGLYNVKCWSHEIRNHHKTLQFTVGFQETTSQKISWLWFFLNGRNAAALGMYTTL